MDFAGHPPLTLPGGLSSADVALASIYPIHDGRFSSQPLFSLPLSFLPKGPKTDGEICSNSILMLGTHLLFNNSALFNLSFNLHLPSCNSRLSRCRCNCIRSTVISGMETRLHDTYLIFWIENKSDNKLVRTGKNW